MSGRTAGEGDVVLIKPAPTYEPGATIEYDGTACTVVHDLGDEVDLSCATGHIGSVPKSDLVLELLR